MREDYGSIWQELKEEIRHCIREELHYQLCEKLLIALLCVLGGFTIGRLGYMLYETLL